MGKITREEQDNKINSDVFSNKVQPDFSNNDTIQLLKAGSWIIKCSKQSNKPTNQDQGKWEGVTRVSHEQHFFF